VNGLTLNTARDWAGKGIRINAVAPGVIGTPSNPAIKDQMIAETPIGRLGEPEEVAEAVLWLCSDHASFVVGTTLRVDGGLALR